MKKLELRIPEEVKAERADKLLARLCPEIAPSCLKEAFRKKDVKRNGQRIAQDTRVFPGDHILLYVEDCLGAMLDIVFQDEAYLVLNKPQGLPVQGAGSLEALCAKHIGAPVFACHRLDVQTGGLVLLAKSTEALSIAYEAFKEHVVGKTYRALVRGRPAHPEKTVSAYLLKEAKAARVRIVDKLVDRAKPIAMTYRVVEADQSVSRLEIDLITGRTHQIRAHLAHLGHPVLGDDKYGDRQFNRANHAKRQKLWSTRLTLWDGRSFAVEEPF